MIDPRNFREELAARLAEQADEFRNEMNARLSQQEQSFNARLNEKINGIMYKMYEYCPDDKRPAALKDWFYERTGEILHLDRPQTYNEKIQWLKFHDSTPQKTRLADKYLVREWVKEKIGEQYLIPLLGVWDSFDNIDFDSLPNQFALKCNHGSGYNIIVHDKSKLDKADARRRVNAWMNEDFSFVNGFELHYSAIPRKIVAEKYLENIRDNLFEYDLWCFDGKVKYIEFLRGQHSSDIKSAFYDRDWTKQDFIDFGPIDEETAKRPDNLDEMIEIAEKLSAGFSHVRVDLYDVNGRIYFCEMTFTTCSGTCDWRPKEKNLEFGRMIRLPE